MIYSLRRKFILISAISVLAVFAVIYGVIFVTSCIQLDRTMDTLTEAIATGGGRFPELAAVRPLLRGWLDAGVITEETPFSTRFFTVWLDKEGHILRVDTDAISSITETQTQPYAEAALKNGTPRGWVEDYRYRVFAAGKDTAIVFVNGAMNRTLSRRFLLTALAVLAGSGLVILGLVVLLSGRAVRPAAESYQKQKQFITDAGHELKTPLTLILSNLDIVEAEVGKNEWIEDIRGEGERMGLLIGQLITLSRMDELPKATHTTRFSLSAAVADTVSEFRPLAEARGKALSAAVGEEIFYRGSEEELRRLVSILLDNAVKYCDEGGEIQVALTQRRRVVLTVENNCRGVESLELEKLFHRFYRGDKARTFSGSFGIGLSIAQAIARNHHGEITAYKREGVIGFRMELK